MDPAKAQKPSAVQAKADAAKPSQTKVAGYLSSNQEGWIPTVSWPNDCQTHLDCNSFHVMWLFCSYFSSCADSGCVAGAGRGSCCSASRNKQGKAQSAVQTLESGLQLYVKTSCIAFCVQAPALDPFAALADSLPSAAPVAPQPVYTGPEVTEVKHSPGSAVWTCTCLCVWVCF